MIRPPLISSAVSMIFAKMPGPRHGVTLTMVPISTRSVTAATPHTIDQHSHVPNGSIPGNRYSRWSATQTESNPVSSAARAMSRRSFQPAVPSS